MKSSKTIYVNKKNIQKPKSEAFSYKGSDPALTEIFKTKNTLAKKIKMFKDRLNFSFSEPLHDSYIELLKQDMELSCKITEELTRGN